MRYKTFLVPPAGLGRSTAARVSLVPAASMPAPAPPTQWAQLLPIHLPTGGRVTCSATMLHMSASGLRAPPPPGCPSPVVAGHAHTRTHDHSHTRTPHRQDRRTHTTLVPLGARSNSGATHCTT